MHLENSVPGSEFVRCKFLVSGARPSIMNRSTSWPVTPTGADVLSVFDYARERRIASRIAKHFFSSRAIGLRVVVRESDALRVVMVARLLTVRAAGFRIDY